MNKHGFTIIALFAIFLVVGGIFFVPFFFTFGLYILGGVILFGVVLLVVRLLKLR